MWFLLINLCFFATKTFEVTCMTNFLQLVTKKQGLLTANAFMCGIKERLQDQGKMPDFYKCYVDKSHWA